MKCDFFYLDIETTAIDPEEGDIIELALVGDSKDDIIADSNVEILPRIVFHYPPYDLRGEFGAIKLNFDKLEELYQLNTAAKGGKTFTDQRGDTWKYMIGDNGGMYYKAGYHYLVPRWEDAQPLIFNFLNVVMGNTDPIKLCGKNISMFDIPWMRQHKLIHKNAFRYDADGKMIVWPLSHRVLDVGTVLFDPNIDSWLPSSKECISRAGLEGDVKHDALGDCLDAARILRWRAKR